MISVKHPGAFNQAIMELGETVCLPNTVPKCELCPLTAVCIGYKTGCASSLPIRSPKKARRIEQRTVLVLVAVNPVSSEKAVLLHRRLSSGLLAGMWELPNTDSWLDADQAAELVREFGGEMTQFQPLETGRHIFSHIEWHLHGYYIPVPYFTAPKEYQWVSGSQLATEYALPTAFRTYSQILPIWLE
jgi:A/G-specific adenine glycosylase